MHETLHTRLLAHLRPLLGPTVEIEALAPLSGGACQELHALRLAGLAGRHPDAPAQGSWRLALRADATSSLPGSLPRSAEFPVIQAAVRAGVPTPQARFLMADLPRPGASAYCLDWVEGEAIGARVLRQPALAAARARLPDQLGAARGGCTGDPCHRPRSAPEAPR